ncbi:MAG TPA: glycosyltransferase family 2 protein [Bryobacteraceae bacterium]|nr:glycosyltransferase family 2 protein [Bryobacteraceae bacterium]
MSAVTAMDISVVIPTYNRAHLISEAIESALSQEPPVREVIIVDDGSTDNTAEVVAGFKDRVRYIRQDNGGPSCARNRGIREARYTWIGLLDSDDWWLPGKVALHQQVLARKPDAALMYNSFYWVSPDGTRELQRAVAPERLWPRLRYEQCVGSTGILVRRDVLLEAGGFDESLITCEDWDLWIRLLPRCRFACVREPAAAIRLVPESLSSDVERMLSHTERILEQRLLAGLEGFSRWCWRRRIRAADVYRAGLIARGAGDARERALLIRSLYQWPSPFFKPARWAALAQNLLGPARYAVLSKPYRQAREKWSRA